MPGRWATTFRAEGKHYGGQALNGRLGVLGGDPGIIWGLAYIRLPVVVAVTDDGLTIGGDVLAADVSADALFAHNVLGPGFCDGHTARHACDSPGKGECGEDFRYVLHG